MSETAELRDRIKALEQELDKLRDRLAVIEARSWRRPYTGFGEHPMRVPDPFEYSYDNNTSWPPDSTSPGPALLHWQPTPVL